MIRIFGFLFTRGFTADQFIDFNDIGVFFMISMIKFKQIFIFIKNLVRAGFIIISVAIKKIEIIRILFLSLIIVIFEIILICIRSRKFFFKIIWLNLIMIFKLK
jgi:hypothetical protein